MRKWLLLLLGLLLIFMLAYFCFMGKASGIKDSLISNTQIVYADKGIAGVNIGIKGEDLEQTRIITLTGTVLTDEEKKSAETLAGNVEGVTEVDNQLLVKPHEIIPETTVVVTEDIVKIPEVVVAVRIPSPYTLNAKKSKDGKITLSGYVANATVHSNLIADAKGIFGDINVIDNLKEVEGSPEFWYDSSKLGLDKLNIVEYGQYEISDNKFNFEGYISTEEKKITLLKNLKANLNTTYSGTYVIDVPEVKVLEPVVVSCQEQFKVLMKENKINFEYDKAIIKSNSYQLLDELVVIFHDCQNDVIVVEGHTDSDGSKSYNQRLSERRANAVREYFIKKGVDSKGLESIGYGETKPIALNDTSAGKEKNRRIEFIIKGVK